MTGASRRTSSSRIFCPVSSKPAYSGSPLRTAIMSTPSSAPTTPNRGSSPSANLATRTAGAYCPDAGAPEALQSRHRYRGPMPPFDRATRVLLWLLGVAFVVSVVHYIDNVVNYADYPQPDPGTLPAPTAVAI